MESSQDSAVAAQSLDSMYSDNSDVDDNEDEHSGNHFAYGPIVSGAMFLIVFGIWFWKMLREHRRGRLVASSWMVTEHQFGQHGLGANGTRDETTVVSDSTQTGFAWDRRGNNGSVLQILLFGGRTTNINSSNGASSAATGGIGGNNSIPQSPNSTAALSMLTTSNVGNGDANAASAATTRMEEAR
jgi:hypothetical protein